MVEGVDVPAIEAKIAQYQEENAEQIMINRARKVLEKLMLLGSVIFSPDYEASILGLLCDTVTN